MDESLLSRREFFRLAGAGAFTLLMQGCSTLPSRAGRGLASDDFLLRYGPIDRTIEGDSTSQFSGERFERPHAALWDPAAFFRTHPVPSPEQTLPLVIVGGGLSGLFSAFELRQYRPLVLEAGDRFGGNARGESWRGIDYGLGSAYFCEPEAGSKLDRLYRAIGLDGHFRLKNDEDPVALRGVVFDGVWNGHAGGGEAAKKLASYLRNCLSASHGESYPDIPAPDSRARKTVDRLDKTDLLTHLETKLGRKLPPVLHAAVEHYCWSSLGGSAREISAAAGLNFLAAEFGGICVSPGGNAGVAERVLQRTLESVPAENFRSGALVVKVAVDAQGALVVYQDVERGLRSVRARAVVMACPKFVAARVLEGIEPERQAAIASLQYRSYLVANVLLRKPSAKDFYDLFLLGDGQAPEADTRAAALRHGTTDVVLANYARADERSAVLTLYRPLPYQGARRELIDPACYARTRAEFEREIVRTILPVTGFSERDLAGLRLTRWAHPLPLARRGIYRSGIVDKLRAPFREQVFFAEQDNWALPALETAAHEALTAAAAVKARLGAPPTV